MADSTASLESLTPRSGGNCELCGAKDADRVHGVAPHQDSNPDHAVQVCGTCAPQLEPGAALDANHWYCLQEAIWSEVPAVAVVSWRLLNQLSAEVWAQDLLGQAYLEDEVLAWAKEGAASEASSNDAVRTFDSNGTELFDGDSVTLIKDLDVKGTSFVAKRGTMVKGIRLTGDPENIDGRVNKISIVLKTCFLKKAN